MCNQLRMSFCKFLLSLLLALLPLGCSSPNSTSPPETGPIGSAVTVNPNPPFGERFSKPPAELYDLEAFAGRIYENSQLGNWPEVQNNFAQMQNTWQNLLPVLGAKKGVANCTTLLPGLAGTIATQDAIGVYQQLNKFMDGIGEIGESYKLTPLNSIITISNGIRDVDFNVNHGEWPKAEKKSKELEKNWEQQKPGFEKFGILGEVTKTHSFVNKIKAAVELENKEAALKQLILINKSMATIRDYYRGE